MLTYGIPPEFRGGVHMKPPYAIGSVPSLSGHAVAYRWRSLPRVRRHRASKPQGSSERVLPWQITMDQLIFASLSHTHYWYEVGMLKVPAYSIMSGRSPPLYCTLILITMRSHQSYHNITTVKHSYEYSTTVDNSTIETYRNRGLGK